MLRHTFRALSRTSKHEHLQTCRLALPIRASSFRSNAFVCSSRDARKLSNVLKTVATQNVAISRAFSTAENGDRHEFQAETRQLLDIVTHSIYTDKEVFVRELISNASDALEKLRHLQATGENVQSPELGQQVSITTNEDDNTLIISDTGIGMSKSELIDNLGTIARSGSKAFLQQSSDPDALKNIIGKFGVGFYSAFMVADKVQVISRSAVSGQCTMWESDGSGSFNILGYDNDDIQRGTKIVIRLKDTCKEYAKPDRIEKIIRQYSNFVSFPIVLNEKTVNTIEALWTKAESEVKEEEYNEFYKFIANAFDDPLYRISFRADAPLELKTLLFIGSSHTEKFGNARMEPGVSLYSRKVLIERDSKDILPDYLRFIRGVVDSEDFPLSISREKTQDSRLVLKIKDVLTRRIVRFLHQQATKDPEKYEKFYKEFGLFIKEGVCTDFQHKDELAKLVRYESSQLDAGKLSSLDEYISRCPPDQQEIYYLCAPSRAIAEASPYYEIFKKTNKEVLFTYHSVDDFVMNNIAEYNGRKIVSAETAKVDANDTEDSTPALSEEDLTEFTKWLGESLSSNVKEIKVTSRLSDSPAIISDHESAALRRMMSMVNQDMASGMAHSRKYTLEINPRHPIIVHLAELRKVKPDVSDKVAQQVYINATVAANLVDDGRSLLTNLNQVLGDLLAESLAKKEDATKS